MTLDDAAGSGLPNGSPLGSGTFKPSSYVGSPITFPSPAPAGPYDYSATDGTATFGGEFDSSNPNGTWSLYSQTSGSGGAGSIAGGWCLNITTAPTTVQVTVGTSPTGLSFTVDSTNYTTTQTFTWTIGTPHTLSTTTPQAGTVGTQYAWANWSNGGPISQTVTAPSTATTYTANFNTQYQLTTAASPSADGTVSPASGSFYNSGMIVNLTATANAGFAFSSWTGSVLCSSCASTSVTMTGPQSVTANFVASTVQIMVGTSPTGLSFTVDSVSYSSTQTFTWTIGTPHTLSTTTPQAGTAGTQYAWANWSNGGTISQTVTAPSTPTTYTANFNSQYQLTTAANPIAGGTVSAASGGFYNSGTIVNLTATANAGYAFSSWTGSVACSSCAATTITMTAPQSVTANFSVSGPVVSLTPTSINFGTVKQYSLRESTVTVKNIGTSTLTIGKISLTLGTADHDDYTLINLCGKTLAAGKSCLIEIILYADNLGTPTATLNVADNAPGGPQTASLTANVIKFNAESNP